MMTPEQFNGCTYAFFDRHGGEGRAPYSSRNISFGVGDDDKIVERNREMVKQSLGLDRLVSAQQVHGNRIYCHAGDSLEGREIEGVDALLTRKPGVGLMIQQADCQAVLLYDPVRRAIAAIHCGWRGSVNGVIAKTVLSMRDFFGTDPEDLLAAVSPSLGPCCAEFINYKKELPEEFTRFQVRDRYFDFWQITRWQLAACGLKASAVTVAGICTVCSPDYFSYRRACRRANGNTGRNCSVIALQKDPEERNGG
jgi:purine-nucleoside/S-methyl-5'-thioadenosine phosphorylase / adenosine deaminase